MCFHLSMLGNMIHDYLNSLTLTFDNDIFDIPMTPIMSEYDPLSQTRLNDLLWMSVGVKWACKLQVLTEFDRVRNFRFADVLTLVVSYNIRLWLRMIDYITCDTFNVNICPYLYTVPSCLFSTRNVIFALWDWL